MRSLRLMITVGLASLLVGCLGAPWHPPSGFIYTGASGVNPSTQVVASDGTRAGTKTGQVCAIGILGLVATGDMSLKAAKAKGGITRVDTLDYRTTSVMLGVYRRNCTIVTGD